MKNKPQVTFTGNLWHIRIYLHNLFASCAWTTYTVTPYTDMNVKLAAQVKSTIFGETPSNYWVADSTGTAKFCLIMGNFFNI